MPKGVMKAVFSWSSRDMIWARRGHYPGVEVQVRGEEDKQKNFGRPTQFGRPTSVVKTKLEPCTETCAKRRTSVEVRTSDMTDVRTLTDVRQKDLRDDPRSAETCQKGRTSDTFRTSDI